MVRELHSRVVRAKPRACTARTASALHADRGHA